MVISFKDAAKLFGISIISFCAVVVCTMFLNFYLDMQQIEDMLTTPAELAFYTAQLSTAKVVCLVSGGCLLVTSVVMLIFYIKHYIDTHKKELGILKAMGYSDFSTAKNFWVFGISVFIGAALGFAGAFILIPKFYELQNEDKILPEIAIRFHPVILLCIVILPTVVFSIAAVAYAFIKLKRPVLALLRDNFRNSAKAVKRKSGNDKDEPFMSGMKKNTLKSRKSLVFFMIFSSFCFSAMTQMSASMKDLSSEMMGAMIFLIGIILACTTFFLAVTTVINGNAKTIAMMRVFGYSRKECRRAVLDCYRPAVYIGFALGTVYQYALLRIMVDIVFQDIEGVPVYEFDVPVCLIFLVSFVVLYEAAMYYYSCRIDKISIKEIMLEN